MRKRALEVLTMTELARIAGVDKSTVSRALENNPLIAAATRERVQALAREHGYTINPAARSLRSRRTDTIAVVIPLTHETDQPLSDPFFTVMLGYLADAVSARGYDLLLSKSSAHADDLVTRPVRTGRADAVIVIGQSLEHEVIETASRDGAPVVAWGAMLADQHYASVGSDNREGGRLAAQHLLDHGRRRLVFLGNAQLPEIAQRLDGFVDAHVASGVEHDAARVVDAHFGRADAREAARGLVASGLDFDGVVCASDIIATAVIRAIEEAGKRVPADVGVVGFDDAPLAAFNTPALTTVRQDVELGARHLVDLALARARGGVAASIQMPVELIVRGSSIPPAAKPRRRKPG